MPQATAHAFSLSANLCRNFATFGETTPGNRARLSCREASLVIVFGEAL